MLFGRQKGNRNMMYFVTLYLSNREVKEKTAEENCQLGI